MQVSYNWQVMLIMNNCSIRHKIKNTLGPGYWNYLFYNQFSISHNSRIFTELLSSLLAYFGSRDKVLPQNWSVKSVIYQIRVRYIDGILTYYTLPRPPHHKSSCDGLFWLHRPLSKSTIKRLMIQSSQIRGSLTYPFVQLQLFTSKTHYKNYTT